MEINGLPLHPLVVHAAVVFAPLAALSALAYVGLPKHRDKLRWVTLVVVLIGFVSIWAAYLTGQNFFGTDRFDHFSGKPLERIEHHQSLARTLRWVATGFALVTVVAVWQHERQGAARYALGGLVAVGAIATLIWTALTGDAGARAVWGS
jgi:membrane protein DedA with SNARE-associated domain